MRFAQIDPTTGLVVSVIRISTSVIGDYVVALGAGAADPTGKMWDGTDFVDPPPAPPPPRDISPVEFISRFTEDELVALKTMATQTTPDGIKASVFWDRIMSMKVLHLDSDMMQAAKTTLVAKGLLTAERAEIVFG